MMYDRDNSFRLKIVTGQIFFEWFADRPGRGGILFGYLDDTSAVVKYRLTRGEFFL
jgi:hypothetical protein